MPKATTLDLIRDALKAATFESARFSHIGPDAEGDEALPTTEAAADVFVKARTRLYRETYLMPQLACALARLEVQTLTTSAKTMLKAAHRALRDRATPTGVDLSAIFPAPLAARVHEGERQLIRLGLAQRNPGHPSRLEITDKGRALLDAAWSM